MVLAIGIVGQSGIFDEEIEQLQGRTTPIGTEEYLLHKRETEGIQKGIRKGEAEKNHEVVENLIVKLGLSN